MPTSVLPIQTTQAFANGMKVNVRLCGSIPRVALNMMHDQEQSLIKESPNRVDSDLPSVLQIPTMNGDGRNARQLCSTLCPRQQSNPLFYQSLHKTKQRRPSPTYEAPSWAVPASGEARLEPVCDSVDRQDPVDLTSQAIFRIGRSPQSDVKLMHITSSRRHAMLFHHSNGSCYLVDCGSAHGTYINGIRVISNPDEGNVVVPTRIRRGSIVRFGGPGAPSFVLKSFSFDLDEMRDCPVHTITSRLMSLPASPVLTAMVQHNTRLNSLGKTAKEELMVHRHITSKRSYDSLETVIDSDDDDGRLNERYNLSAVQQITSPPLSPEQSIAKIVSPDLNCVCDTSGIKRRRVTFSEESLAAAFPMLVSPDVSSDEQENGCCTD